MKRAKTNRKPMTKTRAELSKIDPWKFVLKEKTEKSLRPSMTGVYCDNGYMIASDAHVLVKARADYPKTNEGKVVGKDGKPLKYKGAVLTTYPNYKAVIQGMKDCERYDIDVKELEKKLEKVTKPQKGESGKKLVVFPDFLRSRDLKPSKSGGYGMKPSPSSPGLATYDAYLFKSAILPYMKASGAKSLYMHNERSDARGTFIPAGENLAMIMPLYNSYPEDAEKEKETIVVRTKEAGSPSIPAPGIDLKPKKKPTKKTITMAKKRTTTKKASATLKRASAILQQQKSDYKRIFKSEISKGGNSKTAAKRAGEAYRKKYGATPTARWNNARKTAKRFVNA